MKCIKEKNQEIKKCYYEDEMRNNFEIEIVEIIKEYDNGKITKKYVLEEKQPDLPYWFILKESKSLDVVLKCFDERVQSQTVNK